MYYIQTLSLLKIGIAVSSSSKGNSSHYANLHRPTDLIPVYLLTFFEKLFSMHILGIHRAACLVTNTTIVTKTVYQTAFIVYFFLILLALYLFTGCCCVFWRPRRRPFFGNISMKARIVTTLISLFLYTYQVSLIRFSLFD